MKKISGVIMDWAGTAVDYGCFAPLNAFLKVFSEEKGIDITYRQAREPMGLLKIDHIKAILSMPEVNEKFRALYKRDWNKGDVDEMYASFEKHLFASLKDFTTPIPGVLETMAMLREQGIKIGSTTGYTAKMMEMVLNGGRCLDCGPHCARWEKCGALVGHLGPDTGSLDTYQSFDEVLESVDKQFAYWTDQMCSSLNIIDNAHRALKPVPYVSAFYEDCMESGRDLTEGGAKYNGTGPQASGMATCADSLAAIRQLVFDEKRCTGSELLAAVKDNWKGHEKLYALVNSSKVHHYGNDDDYADELFRYMFECYCRHIRGRKNPRGGEFSPGVYSVNANVAMGLNTNASVDGRKAGEAISDNMGPVHTDGGSHDICGPTALVNSLTKVDHSLASNGTLMNLRFPEESVAGVEGRDTLIGFIDEYMAKQAMHVQFNIMSSATMRAAQKKPEDYKDMLVRVAGYSAYFVELGKPLQKDLIQRTELHF